MALFLRSLSEPSADHRIDRLTEGFLILPVPGRELEFDDLARRVCESYGPFAAFSRKGEDGIYDCVHILPEDPV